MIATPLPFAFAPPSLPSSAEAARALALAKASDAAFFAEHPTARRRIRGRFEHEQPARREGESGLIVVRPGAGSAFDRQPVMIAYAPSPVRHWLTLAADGEIVTRRRGKRVPRIEQSV